MTITIHPDLEAALRLRADAEGLSVEAYVERLVRANQTAEAELEAVALEGLDSGESLRADDHNWTEKQRRLKDRHLTTGTR